jgi:hypothetical protein
MLAIVLIVKVVSGLKFHVGEAEFQSHNFENERQKSKDLKVGDGFILNLFSKKIFFFVCVTLMS